MADTSMMGHGGPNENTPDGGHEETMIRQSLANLDKQRKVLESEMDPITFELITAPSDGVPPMGIDTPLIDGDGYPRGDVDIYRARALRGRLAVLKTDYRNNRKDLEGLLLQLAALKNPKKHQEEKEEQMARTAPKPPPKFDPLTGKWVVMNWDGTMAGIPNGDQRRFHESSSTTPPTSGPITIGEENPHARAARQISALTESPGGSWGDGLSDLEGNDNNRNHGIQHTLNEQLEPFARVDSVAEASPARSAGLLEDDLILQFGSITISNHNHLRSLAGIVPEVAATRQSIPVTVRRHRPTTTDDVSGTTLTEGEVITVNLFPQPWDGRGLIGCHIVPYAG